MKRDTGPLSHAAVAALAASAATALGLLVLWTAQVGAQDVGALQTQIDAAQAEAQGLAADIEAKSAALAQAQAEAQAAAQQEQQLATLLAEGREREAALAQRVAEARARLAETRARLQRALEVLAERLVAIYKGDVPDVTEVILESDGFDDLATRADYLQRIEEADADLAARVRELRNQVAVQLAAVERARAEAAAYNERLEVAHAQIADARAAAEAEAAQLAAARAAQAGALASLRSQVDGWTQQVQELQAASAAEAQQEVASWVGDWAIPQSIVMCESGGNFGALNPSSGAGGAYQILPSTWRLYGGSGLPQDASPAEQHQIASQIWQDSGSSAWACAG
jgi:Skp family chaperone for outer membrane proteins